MDKELVILLIEDDPLECAEFIKYANTIDEAKIVAVTNSSYKGVQYVEDFLPDAIILDLELHRGSGSGLLFLKELRTKSLAKQPYILVTTNNVSEITYDQARLMGTDFIMQKHQEDYCARSVIDFLLIMKETIQNSNRLKNAALYELSEKESPAETYNRIEKKIQTELDLVGISPKVIGRKYLTEAIQLVMEGFRYNIPAEIAKQHNKSDASVERSMQNAINSAWRSTDIEDLTYNYTAKINSDKGVPTLTEFIFYYAQKLKEYQPKKD